MKRVKISSGCFVLTTVHKNLVYSSYGEKGQFYKALISRARYDRLYITLRRLDYERQTLKS